MEFELWWLLGFPLFFALGWLAARVDIKQLLSESRALPLSYFKGLNFLLNEQPDKAIEAFIEVVKVDPQTIELHFALGSLFRRRGEEMFGKLQGTQYEQQGLKFLLEIFEQEKDWKKAIDASRRMDAVAGQSSAVDIANFYCELAVGEMTHSHWEAAGDYLREALNVNRKCARANILLGDIELAQQNNEQAVEVWKRIEGQNPAYLSLIADKLLLAHRNLGREEE